MNLSYIYAKIIKKYIRGKAIYNCNIHRTSVVYSGANLQNVIMGRYSYCGYDCQIVNTVIGSFCSISDHVFIGGAEHPIDWVSTSPVFQDVIHSGPKRRFAKKKTMASKQTVIGNDVWIGHGVTIKQGVKVGDGSVVGSNSVVTKDVPPYAVVAGVPARIIKYRFSIEVIIRLKQLSWWDFPEKKLQRYAEFVEEPALFIDQVAKNEKLGNVI